MRVRTLHSSHNEDNKKINGNLFPAEALAEFLFSENGVHLWPGFAFQVSQNQPVTVVWQHFEGPNHLITTRVIALAANLLSHT